MSDDRIVRVHYFPQQFLRTEDFTQEQAYHMQMRRRHNIAHHVWGIVQGLELRVEEDGPVVQPGMAIDGYGRELILTERKRISDEEFTHRNSDELTVWLQYGRTGSDEVPEGYYKICSTDSQSDFYRYEETPSLILERPDVGYLNARKPKAVASEDIPFTAARTPPDDPGVLWPVYLGKLIRDRSNPQETVYKVEPAGRPSVGLVGEGISSPSGRAAMGLEGKVVEATDETGVTRAEVRPSRFNVSLCHAPQCDADNPLQEHLSITSAGEIDLYGRASIYGDLRMAGGAVEFRSQATGADGLPECAAEQASDVARPWRMYRYRCTRPVEDGGQPVDAPPEVVEELRVELAPINDAKQQLVIGAWSPEDEAFKPFLTVGNVYHPTGEYSVTVHGNLIVKGAISKQEASAPRNLSPEARNFLLGTYASGVSGANLQLVDHYKSPFIPTGCDLESDEGQLAVIQALLQPGNADRPRMVRFVEKMLDTLEARQEIETQLALDSGYIGELMDLALPVDASRAQIISSVVDDATARADVEVALVADAAALRSVTARAVGADADAVAEILLEDAAGAAAAGSYLTTHLASLSAILGTVLNSNAARDRVAEDLVSHAGGPASTMDALAPGQVPDVLATFAGLLQQAGYANRLPQFAAAIAATDAGRRAIIEDGLPETAPATSLNAFVQLAQADFPAWLDAFLSLVQTSGGSQTVAESLVTTAAGRVAIMTAIRDDAPALNAFTALLENTATYGSVLPEFAESLLATNSGRTEVGQQLVADTSHLPGVLSPVLNNLAARTLLAEEVLSSADGRTAAANNLAIAANASRWVNIVAAALSDADATSRNALAEAVLANANGRTASGNNLAAAANATRWVELVAPALAAADAASRDALAAEVGGDDNGQTALADYLESFGPAPAVGTPLEAFGVLINSGTYPELKLVACP